MNNFVVGKINDLLISEPAILHVARLIVTPLLTKIDNILRLRYKAHPVNAV
jgi:hypothetical protein